MADLTPEHIAELRRLHTTNNGLPEWDIDEIIDALPALLDMASECLRLRAENARLRNPAEAIDAAIRERERGSDAAE